MSFPSRWPRCDLGPGIMQKKRSLQSRRSSQAAYEHEAGSEVSLRGEVSAPTQLFSLDLILSALSHQLQVLCVGPRDCPAPRLSWGCFPSTCVFTSMNLSIVVVSFPSHLNQGAEIRIKMKGEGKKEERKKGREEGEKEFPNFVSRPRPLPSL